MVRGELYTNGMYHLTNSQPKRELEDMFDNLNYNVISKSQIRDQIAKSGISEDIFANTVSYSGIENNFHLDVPEILKYEKQLQERRNDIIKFTQLATSDMDNLSHNDLVMELYKDGFSGSEYEDIILNELSANERLLKDLM